MIIASFFLKQWFGSGLIVIAAIVMLSSSSPVSLIKHLRGEIEAREKAANLVISELGKSVTKNKLNEESIKEALADLEKIRAKRREGVPRPATPNELTYSACVERGMSICVTPLDPAQYCSSWGYLPH